MLKNGSFTEGWTDMPPAPGYLINQQPKHWTLNWLDEGEKLYGSNDEVKGIPECVHKLQKQLPPNEHPGAEEALILEGDTTYKIFHFAQPFGAELKQTVTGLQAGTSGTLTVPVLVDLHGDTDKYGAESGAWVDTVGSDDMDDWEGGWANSADMGNRTWYYHEVEFTVPSSGAVTVYIRVKNKWPNSKDFFIDGVKMEATAGTGTGSGDSGGGTETGTGSSSVVRVQAPAGVNVIMENSDEANTIVVKLPPGMTLEVD